MHYLVPCGVLGPEVLIPMPEQHVHFRVCIVYTSASNPTMTRLFGKTDIGSLSVKAVRKFILLHLPNTSIEV